jgi:hypothetical protein
MLYWNVACELVIAPWWIKSWKCPVSPVTKSDPKHTHYLDHDSITSCCC